MKRKSLKSRTVIRLALFVAFIAVLGAILDNRHFYAGLLYTPVPKDHVALIREAREFCGLPEGTEHIIASVASVESNFRENAQSGAGAVGVMQVLRPTGYGMAVKFGIPGVSAETYLKAKPSYMMGTCYLRYLGDILVGDGTSPVTWESEINRRAIFAGYNGGPAQGKGVLAGTNSSSFPVRVYARRVEERLPVYKLELAHAYEQVELTAVEKLSNNLRDIFANVIQFVQNDNTGN